MTNREFLTAVSVCENCSEEVREYAKAAIAKMDATNEARKNKPSKKSEENAPIMNQILTEILTTEAQTAAAVAEAAGISVQKASSLLRALVAAKKATVVDVKIPKKGTQKAYALAEAETDAE